MANVTIDIPGIGNIEAKNAATESTLKELVNAITNLNKTVGKTAAKSATGTGTGTGTGGSSMTAPAKAAISFAGKLGSAAKAVTVFAGATVGAVKAVGEFAGALSAMIGDIANVEDSLRSAANEIPLLGSFFAPIAGAIEKSVGAYQKATASGATFGNSVNGMAQAASAAGMTLDKFANLIATNGESMRLLGGSTEDGAKRFAQLSKNLRTSGFMTDLNNLGFTTEEVNQGMANYVKYLGQTGKIGNKTNAELAAGSAKYLKEMDLLAKVTGETRKEQEDARQKLLNDAQYQAKIATMGAEAGEAFANTINGLPPGLRDVAKDIMVTGTATTDEAQKFTALMPKSAALMQKYAAITQAGGTITREMQQELQNTMAMEGREKKVQFQTQGMYNKELAGSFMNVVQASNIQTDALKKSAAGQDAAKKTTDNMAAASEAAKRKLAEVSNSFTMMLANSGMLDTLMSAFGMFTQFVQSVVMPVFTALGAVIKPLISILSAVLTPVFSLLGAALNATFMPLTLLSEGVNLAIRGIYAITDTLQDIFRPPLMMMGRIFDSVSSFIRDNFLSAIKEVSDYFKEVFKPVLDYVTPIFSSIGKIFDRMSTAVGNFFRGFNTLGDVVEYMGLKFRQLGLNLTEMWYAIKDFIPGLKDATPEERAALEADRAALAQDQMNFDKRHERQAADNLKKQKEEERKVAKEREARDKQFYTDKTARDEAASRSRESATSNIDYSDPTAMAKTFFAQQRAPAYIEAEKSKIKSKIEDAQKEYALNPRMDADKKKALDERIAGYQKQLSDLEKPQSRRSPTASPTDRPPSTSSAEGTRRQMETDAAKKAEDERRSREKENSPGTNTVPSGTPGTPTQESVQSQLVTLNTNVSELVRITKANTRVFERQLDVQQGLSGDLWANPAA